MAEPPPVRATPRPAAVPTSVPGAPAVRTAVPISMPGGAPKPPGRLPSLKSGGGASASPAGPRPPVVTSTPTSSPSSSSSSALASVAVKSESFSAPPVVRTAVPVGSHARPLLPIIAGPSSGDASKPKFAPTIPAERRKKVEPAAVQSPKADKEKEKRGNNDKAPGRGRGRGRGHSVVPLGQVAFQGTAQTPEQRVGAVRGGNGGNGSGGGGGSGGSGGGGGRGSSNGVDYEDDSSKFSEDSDEFHETTSTRLSDLPGANAPLSLEKVGEDSGLEEADDMDGVAVKTEIKPEQMDDIEYAAGSSSSSSTSSKQGPTKRAQKGSSTASGITSHVGEPAAQLFTLENDMLVCDKSSVFFFQFPTALPILSQPEVKPQPTVTEDVMVASSNGAAGSSSSAAAATAAAPVVILSDERVLEDKVESNDADLPPTDEFKSQIQETQEGRLGKLIIHKSGKMKLKLGNFVYDIHAGTDCNFLQQVVAINPEDRGLSVMGTVKKRFIATPDFDQLIQSSMHL